jgi:molecular chaperone GrpE
MSTSSSNDSQAASQAASGQVNTDLHAGKSQVGPSVSDGSPESQHDAPAASQSSAVQSESSEGSTGLVQELEQLRTQVKGAQEQALRAMAEMENLRKRTANEVSNAHKYAVESFAESLVPVLDSLELSLKVDKPTVETLKEGAEATLRLLNAAFEKNHLVAIEPAGERFDPNRHQAISMVPGSSVSPAVSANHVVTVLQKGYLIHDRVLRPALVTVAQA